MSSLNHSTTADTLPAHTPVGAEFPLVDGKHLPTVDNPANTRLPVLSYWCVQTPDGTKSVFVMHRCGGRLHFSVYGSPVLDRPDMHEWLGLYSEQQRKPLSLKRVSRDELVDRREAGAPDAFLRRMRSAFRFEGDARCNMLLAELSRDRRPAPLPGTSRYDKHGNTVNSHRVTWRGTRSRLAYEWTGYASWTATRQSYREVGQAMRQAIREMQGGSLTSTRQRAVSSDVLGTIQDALGLNDAIEDRIIDAFNAHCPVYGLEIVRAGCGHLTLRNDLRRLGTGSYWCDECFDSNTVHCEDDDERYPEGALHYWPTDECYHLTPYSDEGQLEGWSSSTAYLDHDRHLRSSQHGDFTMGIELECEVLHYSNRSNAVVDCKRHFNSTMNYAMFKADGSLDSDRGFEIVTAARGLKDHIDKFTHWKPHYDLRSWQPGSCGMHTHIDSRAFTALSLGKFMQFFNLPGNVDFIREIAGRHPERDDQAADYAASLDSCDVASPSKALKSPNRDRYRMVNLTNLSYDEMERLKVSDVERTCKGGYSTVEVRIFRGTLKKARLLAQIEFAHAAVLYCRVASMHELDRSHFLSWLGGCTGMYPNLARFFGLTVVKIKPNTTRPSTAEV